MFFLSFSAWRRCQPKTIEKGIKSSNSRSWIWIKSAQNGMYWNRFQRPNPIINAPVLELMHKQQVPEHIERILWISSFGIRRISMFQ